MIKTLRLFMSVILLCLFSIPAFAQEGRIGIRPEAEKPVATEVKPLMPKPADFSELRSLGVVVIDQVIDPLRVQQTDGRIVQFSGIERIAVSTSFKLRTSKFKASTSML